MEKEVRIQVIFTENLPEGNFRDALSFSPEEYALKTPEEIDLACKASLEAHLVRVRAPRPIEEQPPEAKQAYLDELILVKKQQESKIAELKVDLGLPADAVDAAEPADGG